MIDRQLHRARFRALDNPIWSALTTSHTGLALGDGLVRRYPPEIGPLSGLAEPALEAYAALRELTEIGGTAVVFLETPPEPREAWETLRAATLDQMVWMGSELAEREQVGRDGLRRLTGKDTAQMVELARMTEPGPFERRTHELGTFFGIFDGGRLLAMAGERLRAPGLAEVSAVCTHPEARGRGYARRLMLEVMAGMLERRERPMLHVRGDNGGAIRVYEALGFRRSKAMYFEVLKRVK